VTHFFPVEVDTSVDMEEETKDWGLAGHQLGP